VRADREPYEHDAVEIGLLAGDAKTLDGLELTDDEWKAEKAELAERLARKVPLGFRAETATTHEGAGRFPFVPPIEGHL
jgi:hypothetical protein